MRAMLLRSRHGDRRMTDYVLDRLVEAVVYGIVAEGTRGVSGVEVADSANGHQPLYVLFGE